MVNIKQIIINCGTVSLICLNICCWGQNTPKDGFQDSINLLSSGREDNLMIWSSVEKFPWIKSKPPGYVALKNSDTLPKLVSFQATIRTDGSLSSLKMVKVFETQYFIDTSAFIDYIKEMEFTAAVAYGKPINFNAMFIVFYRMTQNEKDKVNGIRRYTLKEKEREKEKKRKFWKRS